MVHEALSQILTLYLRAELPNTGSSALTNLGSQTAHPPRSQELQSVISVTTILLAEEVYLPGFAEVSSYININSDRDLAVLYRFEIHR